VYSTRFSREETGSGVSMRLYLLSYLSIYVFILDFGQCVSMCAYGSDAEDFRGKEKGLCISMRASCVYFRLGPVCICACMSYGRGRRACGYD